MKNFFLFTFFLLVSTTFSQTAFIEGQIVQRGVTNNLRDIKIGDLNGDDKGEIILVSDNGNKLFYLINDGEANFEELILIEEEDFELSQIAVGDLDNDGDNDICYVSAVNSKLGWFENLDGLGNFSSANIISDEFELPQFISLSDINNDSFIDICVSNFNGYITWYPNFNGQGSFGMPISITQETSIIHQIDFADIDGDSFLDIIYYQGTEMAWRKNLNGIGNFGQETTIDITTEFIITDIDNDGDQDILSFREVGDTDIVYYLNEDGLGTFSFPQIVIESVKNPTNLEFFDYNNDGKKDIFFLSNWFSTPFWIEGGNSPLDFLEPMQINSSLKSPTLRSILVDNLDDDEFLELFEIREGGLIAIAQVDDNIEPVNEVVAPEVFLPEHVEVGDIDADGDLDYVIASKGDGKISWIENTDGAGNFALHQNISTDVNSPDCLTLGDFNGDNFLDIAVVSYSDNELSWFENEAGIYGEKKIISGDNAGDEYVIYHDMDLDGDLDILTVNEETNELLWFENIDGLGTFSDKIIIDDSVSGLRDVHPADFDNDGDFDLLCASYSGFILWYERADETILFEQKIIYYDEGSRFHSSFPVDLDNDGDLDIVAGTAALFGPNITGWFENVDGEGTFENLIPLTQDRGAYQIKAVDLDQDNDFDVALVDYKPGAIGWYENQNNASSFSPRQIIKEGVNNPSSIDFGDFDRDGDFDLLFSIRGENEVVWYRNILELSTISGTCFYDENENQLFDDNEIGLRRHSAILQPNAIVKFSNEEGDYRFFVQDGTYKVNITPEDNWVFSTDSTSYTIAIDSNSVENLDFGLKPTSYFHDIVPNIVGAPSRCNTSSNYWFGIKNEGTLFSSGMLSLEYSDIITLDSFLPEPDSIEGNTLFYFFENLPPYYSQDFLAIFSFPGVGFIGDSVDFIATSYVFDSNGVLSQNETDTFTTIISCAYDPNDKLVNPVGLRDQFYTEFGTEFEYTIRFQNTGNDTAFMVKLKDQLDEDLDWTTFRPIFGSHPFEATLIENGQVEFLFNDILLPDSTTNEIASHGFVKYKIRHKEGLLENTEIQNYAEIFFDFNPPIRTNTVLNTLVSDLPENLEENENSIEVIALPNPFSNQLSLKINGLQNFDDVTIQISDLNGRIIRVYENIEREILNIESHSIPKGIYIYSVFQNDATKKVGKLLKL